LPEASSVPQALPIRVLATGATLDLTTDLQVVIRDAAPWQDFYAAYAGGPSASPPSVDFTQDMVVAIVLIHPTSGYAVALDSVTLTESQLTVSYTNIPPPPGVIVFEAFTDSYLFAAVPRTDPGIPVVFQGSVASASTPQPSPG
jgi:hypothetical protein